MSLLQGGCGKTMMDDDSDDVSPADAVVQKALDTIFRLYHPMLVKYLWDRLDNEQDVEDVAQEVYYRLARVRNLENLDYPKAYLIRVAKNLLIDMNRYRHLRIAAITDIPVEGEGRSEGRMDSTSPDQDLEGVQRIRAIEEGLRQLSAKCRAVFVMNRIDGISYRQIAKDLNMSKSMVEKYMRQALARLIAQTAVQDDQG